MSENRKGSYALATKVNERGYNKLRTVLSMRSIWHKHRRLLVAILSLILLAVMLEAWWLTAGARGTLLARFDLWRGHYAIHTYGLNLSGREFARMLRERYGIETHVDGFCLVSESEREFADSYNKLGTAAANQKFGHDVFKECSEEARREWEARRAQLLQSQ